MVRSKKIILTYHYLINVINNFLKECIAISKKFYLFWIGESIWNGLFSALYEFSYSFNFMWILNIIWKINKQQKIKYKFFLFLEIQIIRLFVPLKETCCESYEYFSKIIRDRKYILLIYTWCYCILWKTRHLQIDTKHRKSH